MKIKVCFIVAGDVISRHKHFFSTQYFYIVDSNMQLTNTHNTLFLFHYNNGHANEPQLTLYAHCLFSI